MLKTFKLSWISKYIVVFGLAGVMFACQARKDGEKSEKKEAVEAAEEAVFHVDSLVYKKKLTELANGDTTGRWPVQAQPVPLDGAILPFYRIVAYYGNLYSKKMGILGEVPPKELWQKLKKDRKSVV